MKKPLIALLPLALALAPLACSDDNNNKTTDASAGKDASGKADTAGGSDTGSTMDTPGAGGDTTAALDTGTGNDTAGMDVAAKDAELKLDANIVADASPEEMACAAYCKKVMTFCPHPMDHYQYGTEDVCRDTCNNGYG